MRSHFLLLVFLCFSGWLRSQVINATDTIQHDSILKVEMHLSAFGVESDDFPSIDVVIDFVADTNRCYMSYYNPAHKDSVYRLTKEQMHDVASLLDHSDLDQLKPEYSIDRTDQPSSTTIITTNRMKYHIEDYGLVGEYPLRQLYRIVYRF